MEHKHLNTRSLGEDSDNFIAFRWGDPFPSMLLTIDAILHKEVPLLLEVCSTVTTHIALWMNMLIPELYKYTSVEKTVPESKFRKTSQELFQVIPFPLQVMWWWWWGWKNLSRTSENVC